jgi:hypothetical protein
MSSINIIRPGISLQQFTTVIYTTDDEGSVQQAVGLQIILLSNSICQ